MSVDSINMMILDTGESPGAVYVLEGGKREAQKLKEKFHEVFVKEKVDDFLKSLTNLIEELRKLDMGLKVLGESASVAGLGDMGKMISIRLGFPEEFVILQYAKRVWKNPKDPKEIYISYEVNIYLNSGLFDNFQRVIVRKGDILYNVSLKV